MVRSHVPGSIVCLRKQPEDKRARSRHTPQDPPCNTLGNTTPGNTGRTDRFIVMDPCMALDGSEICLASRNSCTPGERFSEHERLRLPAWQTESRDSCQPVWITSV